MFQGSRVQGLNCQEGLDDLRHGSKREWGKSRQKTYPFSVAQVSNLLYRRFPIGRTSPGSDANGRGRHSQAGSLAIRQVGNLRDSVGGPLNTRQKTFAAPWTEAAMSSRGDFSRQLGSTRPVVPSMTGFSISVS